MLICLSLLMVGISHAQNIYNGTSLYVSEGGLLHVPGSIENEGYLQNNGTLKLQGNWSNENTYNGDGEIVLDGDQEQHITNHDQPIARLNINGPAEKWIEGLITITKNINLENGIIRFANEGKLYLDHNATITGGSSSSYIDGPLTQEGNGYKFFQSGRTESIAHWSCWMFVA